MKKIRLVGPVFGVDKDKCFKSANLFLFPSKFDTFPLVILEAMSYGIPVISTDIGGIADIVQDGVTGYLTRVGDVDEMTNSITKLIENPELLEMFSNSSMNLYKEKFSLIAFRERFLSVVYEIIN